MTRINKSKNKHTSLRQYKFHCLLAQNRLYDLYTKRMFLNILLDV